jgi:polyisoprenoid-binding protein YceI
MRFKSFVLGMLAVAGAAGVFAADTYQLDASHASVGFSVRHLGISNVKGSFPRVSGTLVLDEKSLGKSSVEVTIDAASVDTNDESRDKHLRAADFFEVDKHPTITFKSTMVVRKDDGFVATGDLTIKGVTKSVEIPFALSGPTDHPMAPLSVLGIEGSLTINRRDFNITYGPAVVIGDQVKIDLHVEFNRPRPAAKK